jgi:HK97 family phage prohead protease
MKRYTSAPIARDDAHFKFVATDNTVRISGYASVFGVLDAHGDIVDRGAFAGWLATGQKIPLRYEHQLPNIGLVTYAEEDDYGLRFEAELTPGHSVAADVAAELRHGTVTGVSFGAFWDKKSVHDAPDGRHLTAIEPFEISLTSTPANRAARIADVKSALEEAESLAEIEAVLRDAGTFSRAEATALVSKIRTIVRGERVTKSETQDIIAAISAAFDNHLRSSP